MTKKHHGEFTIFSVARRFLKPNETRWVAYLDGEKLMLQYPNGDPMPHVRSFDNMELPEVMSLLDKYGADFMGSYA